MAARAADFLPQTFVVALVLRRQAKGTVWADAWTWRSPPCCCAPAFGAALSAAATPRALRRV